MSDSKARVRRFQRRMNRFTSHHLSHIQPLMVDGDKGVATKRRIKLCKYWLGYPRDEISLRLGAKFWKRLLHPRMFRYADRHEVLVGVRRRVTQRRKARQNARIGRRTTGVGTYDGKPCANWLIPYLRWARDVGTPQLGRWRGGVNSAFRSPSYSEHLCYQICGRPSCPGRCAGRSSNHTKSTKPEGALDVSDYVRFGQLMAHCPLHPRLYNALGAADPVHFSASGR